MLITLVIVLQYENIKITTLKEDRLLETKIKRILQVVQIER